jgi:hypothetical protein
MKKESHQTKTRFLIERINEINAWRHEAIKDAISPQAVQQIEDRVLQMRNKAESNN